MNLLDQIVEHKRGEIADKMKQISLEYLKSEAAIRKAPPWCESLRAKPVGLIAEMKRKSPSAGELRPNLGAGNMADLYDHAGVQALSILMDYEFFGGMESDFVTARKNTELPILYKEFIISCWQIWHAASFGASAVLLIVAALSRKELEDLIECARLARMAPLVEVHTAEELQIALDAGAQCVGINNRDLKTLEISLETTYRLAENVPEDVMLISESGIRTADDVVRLKDAGVQAILVGEHLLRQESVEEAIRELMSGVWASS